LYCKQDSVALSQVAQAAPPVPQAVSVVPDLHDPPLSQHPSLQFEVPHWGTTQMPFEHWSVLLQVVQVLPLVPQALVAFPGMQAVPEQQPEQVA
jgi:hypothetical protein